MTRWFGLMLAGYGVGAVGSLLWPSPRGVRVMCALGAIVGGTGGLGLGLNVLVGGGSFALDMPAVLSISDGLALRLDGLGAFFVGIVGMLAVPCGLYGLAYSRAYEGRHSLRLLGVMLNLFLLSMSLVPCADNVLTFLLVWESMSLASYFLVLTESDEPDTVAAGWWYLAMAHVSLTFILAAFLILAGGAATTAFGDLRAGMVHLSPATCDAVFLLALVGFGLKAGIMPLHVWLPRAHPAAPSHVSALMSGVMIKLGVYGLLRIGLDLLGGGPAWWGALLIILGAMSALIGVLSALMEDDLKRLLAYSSVENVGLIFLGLGAGFLFRRLGAGSAALLAFTAALYHVLNHAAFKALLFLGAGSVLHATHTRDMNRLGGLIRGLPWTAAFFLVGVLAVAGLPPLNGFVSEWLLFQSLLSGFRSSAPMVAPLMTLAVGVLALTAGLAAAGFVKAFGITFLAISRTPAAEHGQESAASMRVSMGVLALACVGFGLGAVWVLPVLAHVLPSSAGQLSSASVFISGPFVTIPGGLAQIAPAPIALGLIVMTGGSWLVVRLCAADKPVRVSETWGCGRVAQTRRMEYTSTAFAEPLRRVFAELYRPTEDLSIDRHPESRYFIHSIKYRSQILPWFERYLYAPLIATIRRWGGRARALQSGSAHAYLTYLVLALLGLLTVLLVRSG